MFTLDKLITALIKQVSAKWQWPIPFFDLAQRFRQYYQITNARRFGRYFKCGVRRRGPIIETSFGIAAMQSGISVQKIRYTGLTG